MEEILIIHTSEEIAQNPRFRYCIEFIKHHPLKPDNARILLHSEYSPLASTQKNLYYAENPPKDVSFQMVPQKLFFTKSVNDTFNYGIGKYSFFNKDLYSVEQKYAISGRKFIVDSVFQMDIFESIFFHLSRWEEYNVEEFQRNQFDQIPEEAFLLVKNGIHEYPIVDHLIKAFFEALGWRTQELKTSIIISHDIDYAFKFSNFKRNFHFAGSLLKRNPAFLPKYVKDCLFTRLGFSPDPFTNEKKYLTNTQGIEKHIYFIVESQHSLDPDVISHAEISRISESAIQMGYTIGLHPRFNSGKDPYSLAHQKMILERITGAEITNNRFHFLQFHFPEFLEALEATGFSHDSSLGYAEYMGFRCGTGFSFKMYNLKQDAAMKITQIPLVWMDSSARHASNYGREEFVILSKEFLNKNKFNTQICLNFHNSAFYDYELYGIKIADFYHQIIRDYDSK
jgi:hypothetical protein